MFATPTGHTGCDSYVTAEYNRFFFFYRHLLKVMAGRLPWESDVSDDEVLLLYAVGNKRQRKWVHEVYMKRREFGEFHDLMKQLRQDEVKFKEYFRMSSNQFEQLLSFIKDGIEKKEESISAEERLALCLR
jgi:hypothetical protein